MALLLVAMFVVCGVIGFQVQEAQAFLPFLIPAIPYIAAALVTVGLVFANKEAVSAVAQDFFEGAPDEVQEQINGAALNGAVAVTIAATTWNALTDYRSLIEDGTKTEVNYTADAYSPPVYYYSAAGLTRVTYSTPGTYDLKLITPGGVNTKVSWLRMANVIDEIEISTLLYSMEEQKQFNVIKVRYNGITYGSFSGAGYDFANQDIVWEVANNGINTILTVAGTDMAVLVPTLQGFDGTVRGNHQNAFVQVLDYGASQTMPLAGNVDLDQRATSPDYNKADTKVAVPPGSVPADYVGKTTADVITTPFVPTDVTTIENWLSQVWTSVRTLTATIATTFSMSIPANASINFTPLYVDLKMKFPFSIPWDIKNQMMIFDVTPVAPHIIVDELMPSLGGVSLGRFKMDIDMSQFNTVASVCRWGELIIFTIGLAFGFSKMEAD